jgi:large subunit ribosomal protein L25
MEKIQLAARERNVFGKQVKRLRAGGWVPAVVYGANVAPKSVQLETTALFKTMQEAGSTALIDLVVEGESAPRAVIARDIQRDILTGRYQHVDFFQVRLDHKVKISPALEIVGEAPAVKEHGGVLVHLLTHVEVECLPTDLIDAIEVDVSSLKHLDDSITIGDLPVPPGVTILADPGDAVVSVVPPRAVLAEEEEEEYLPEGVEVIGEFEEEETKEN